MNKIGKQYEYGNRSFNDIVSQVKQQFEKVKKKLNILEAIEVEKVKESQMVRDAIYNGVANKLDGLIEQLSKEIDESKY